jgi:hypothetical protein
MTKTTHSAALKSIRDLKTQQVIDRWHGERILLKLAALCRKADREAWRRDVLTSRVLRMIAEARALAEPPATKETPERFCNKCGRVYRGPPEHPPCPYFAAIVHHHNIPPPATKETP